VGDGTDLVTIALGLNDAGYGAVVFGCSSVAAQDPQGSPCRNGFSTPGGDSIAAMLPAIRDRLAQLVRTVRARAPQARVILVGYPQMVPTRGTCATLPFAAGDYDYVRRFFVSVNAMVEQVARQTGVRYVDMLAASRGHSACATDQPWLAGAVNGSNVMVFHPRARWHRAVAAMVLDELASPRRR
jgi:lysophospholipase L1-like esterase